MNNQYKQYRTCANCDFEDERTLSIIEASFASRSEWKEACSHCGGNEFSGSNCEIPLLSREALELWCGDKDLYFLDQDEDILIAEAGNLDLLIEYLDNEKVNSDKRSILLSVLCILLYDNLKNVPSSEDTYDDALAKKVKTVLLKRLHYFEELNSSLIEDYIKKYVYQELGLVHSNP